MSIMQGHHLPTERVLKYLQIGECHRALEEISEIWNEAHMLLDVQKWSKPLPKDEFILRFHPYASNSKAIARLLKDAHMVWLFAVTLGETLERCSKRYLAQNEVFRGYVLDRIGSFLVEEEIRSMDLDIIQECRMNCYTTTHRYSPGYGDFSIRAQRIFFNLAKDYIHGLRISSGSILFPEKTVTAIKGVVKC